MRRLSSPTVDFGSTRKARSEGKLSAGDKTLISRAEGSIVSGAGKLSVTIMGWVAVEADEDEDEEKKEDEEDASSARGEDIGESGGEDIGESGGRGCMGLID